ncbi:PAS domain-containing protein [Hymenobacter humi]|uniref:histidine kinase n=1 Tax=Hymenobacter humi TaxID=1411620 RepID=A0ABW2TYD8_9BACT
MQPYYDAAGHLAGFSAATIKIHELHERTEEWPAAAPTLPPWPTTLPRLAWMADPTGAIFWYNQQWYDYTGTTLETMLGWGWQQVHDPAFVEGVRERYLASIAAGQLWEDTFPLRRADGQFRWFLSRARPIRDEATGEVVRWFGTNTDVTELRQLQTQLSASEEELRIQAESIPQQVWTARPDGTVDFFNHRMAAYVGESMEKNGAAHWLNFVHPDDLAPMQARWQQAIASQRYFEAEFRLRRYDGEYHWFWARPRPAARPAARC